MRVEIESNAGLVAAAMMRVTQRLPDAVHEATRAVAQAAEVATTRAMIADIYSQPLPPSYAEYGLGERSGALLAGETLLETGPAEFLITTVDPGVSDEKGQAKYPEIYAEWRHEYRKLPAPWRTRGHAAVSNEAVAIFERALMDDIRQFFGG